MSMMLVFIFFFLLKKMNQYVVKYCGCTILSNERDKEENMWAHSHASSIVDMLFGGKYFWIQGTNWILNFRTSPNKLWSLLLTS